MTDSDNDIAICFVSNAGYLPHFSVSLVSFLEHNPGQHRVFLFNEDVDEGTFSKLEQMVKRFSPKSSLHDMKLDTTRLDHFTGYWEKLGKQVFHRLLIPELLPASCKYALYLDADIVIREQFEWNDFPMAGFPVAAVKDNISHLLAPKRGLEKYFNAGVMWLNLGLWREMKAVETLLIHQPKITRFAEQELLNEVFSDKWYELPIKYNYAANKLRFGWKMKNGEAPVVIHYVGPIKPWIYWVKGSGLYWRYIKKTPYRYLKKGMPITIWNSIKHVWKSRVVR